MFDLAMLYAAIDATWPAAKMTRLGPWTLREGQVGGKRVSATTTEGDLDEVDLSDVEDAMRSMNQTPLFMVRPEQQGLDQFLAAKGYDVVDPVNIYHGPLQAMADAPIPRAKVFDIWPPLAIQTDIWASGGIGPERVAVMDRAEGPKTAILGRYDQTAAATAFAAVSGDLAMVHALEVLDSCRKLGVGRMMTCHVARWGLENGASHLAALCTENNSGANALYASLGLRVVGQYHYRMLHQ
jgi:GNAT superfamily N-acetyltransferase